MIKKRQHNLMRMAYRYYLIIFMMIAALSSCSDDEFGGGSSFASINENLYPLLFDVGSYWIYKNKDNDNTDTVKLVNTKIDTLYINTGNGFSQHLEIHILDYVSTFYGNFSDTYKGYVIMRGVNSSCFIYLSSFKIGDSSLNARIANIHDSLIINGATYIQVVEMEISEDGYNLINDMRIFYSDSVGIVKKILFDNMTDSVTWELVDYEAVLQSW